MHPGPDEPGRRDRRRGGRGRPVGDHRPGAPTASPCGWPCSTCSSVPAPTWSSPPAVPAAWSGTAVTTPRRVVIRGGDGRRRRRLAAGPTCRSAAGSSAPSGPSIDAGPGVARARRRRAASCAPASSTCTPTSASRAARRPRRSRPAAGPPPSAATRPWSPCPTPTRPSTPRRWSARSSSSAGPRVCDVAVAGAITVGRQGRQLAPMAEMAALGVRLFTDDGAGVQDARLMRRALEYALGARRDPGPALRGRRPGRRRPHARGRVVEPARASPACPAEAEELMVMRDLALCPPDRRADALPAPVDRRVGRHGPRRQGARACPSPPRWRPTTSRSPTPRSPSLRPGVQGEPAAAHRRRRGRGPGAAGRRDHRRHRHRPRPARPGGQGGALRRGARRDARPRDGARRSPLTELRASRSRRCSRLLSWQPARDRRAAAAEHGGPVVAGRPANLCVFDPDRAVGGRARPPWPAAAATRPSPGARCAGRVRHTVLRGEPVVVDGEAQR